MNSQELRALQEAYIQVYDEDYKPWDFGPKQNAQAKYAELAQRKAAGGSAPGTATRANKIASVGREMRTTLDKNSAATGTNPAKQGLQPATQRHTDAALRGAGGGMTASKAYVVKPLKPASKGGGNSAPDVTDDPNSKPIAARLKNYKPMGGARYGIAGVGLADSYDLYDIILSHLLDEGYAETQEQAEVIMVNMSEDWRESICEEYKKLPLGKMMRKVQKRATRESDTRAEIEYDPTFPTMKALKAAEKASRENKRSDTMIKVADEHDPKKSKRKEDDNRREGGRKRDAGRPRRNELQDNW